jgi:hypothetical protein
MKRFLILCALMFLALTLWSSTASAYAPIGDWITNGWFYTNSTTCEAQNWESKTADSQPDANGRYFVYECRPTSNRALSDPYHRTNLDYREYDGAQPPPPPVCESPNYIDVGSGECVPPTELCFTTIESMASECVYIGEDDPDDTVPEGCVINSAGMQMCLTDDPACYLVDGKNVCPEPDNVCGIKNGTFSCVDLVEEGCGTFNGELVCFTTEGVKVESDSPDHPDNGGNLDGDDSNDVTDSRTPEEGGDPDNQAGPDTSPIQTLDADRATEQTARDSLKELKTIDDRLRKLGQGTQPTGDEGAKRIDSGVLGLLNDTGIDSLTSGIETNPFSSGDLSSVPGIVQGVIPTGICTSYSVDVLGFGTFAITCDDTAFLRSVMAWILYAITAIYLFQLLTTPVRS